MLSSRQTLSKSDQPIGCVLFRYLKWHIEHKFMTTDIRNLWDKR